MKSVSVIIPLYNEKDSLRELHTRLCGELKKTGLVAEIIFVDATTGKVQGQDRTRQFASQLRAS